MTTPIVHLNGTSRDDLIEQRVNAVMALAQARRAVTLMAPNGRDYYVVEGLFEIAQNQHEEWMRSLHKLNAQITEEVFKLQEGIGIPSVIARVPLPAVRLMTDSEALELGWRLYLEASPEVRLAKEFRFGFRS